VNFLLVRLAGPGLVALALVALLTSRTTWRDRPPEGQRAPTSEGAAYQPINWPEFARSDFVWREPVGGAADLFAESLVAQQPAKGSAGQPELFRLQLAGYVGVPGDYRATLVTPDGFDTWLARPGQRFDGLGLVLKGVTVTTERDVEGVGEVVARAVLWDERTATEVVLDTRSVRPATVPLSPKQVAQTP
jgi:hypothetical protein